MLSDRGVVVDHSTLFRLVQAYAAKLEQRIRRHLRLSTGSWRVDETYIKVKGAWTYLYRAVDSLGLPAVGAARCGCGSGSSARRRPSRTLSTHVRSPWTRTQPIHAP